MKRFIALAVVVLLSVTTFAQKATFTGKVFDNSTQKAVSAFVQLIPAQHGQGIFVKTDSLGQFSQKVLPGKYFLCVTAKGYLPYVYSNPADTVKPNQGAPCFVDPTTGQGVDFQGSFNFNGQDQGQNGNGPSVKKYSLITLVADSTYTLAIGLDLIPVPVYAILKGSVIDESTKLPLQASVRLLPATATTGKPACVNVSKDGKFVVKVVAGDYLLQTSAKGYIAEFFDNATDPSKATKLSLKEKDTVSVSIALAKYVPPTYYKVSGKVTDTTGKAVQASIKYFVLNNKAIPRDHKGARTDKDGNYSISVKEKDTIVVFAEPSKNSDLLPEYYLDKKELSEATRIAVTGNVTGIDFKLDPKPVYANSVAGKVTSATNEVLLAHVVLYNLTNKAPKAVKRSVFTDTLTGEYKFSNIVPGKYIVLAIPERGYVPSFYKADGSTTLKWTLADTLVVAEKSAIAAINFKLAAGKDSGYAKITGHIKGSVSNSGNANGALVFATDLAGNVSGVALVDEKGNFNVSGLLPGSYSVSVDKVGYATTTVTSTAVDYKTAFATSTTLDLVEQTVTAVESNIISVAKDYQLYQNYPNPFNPTTNIKFSLPQASNVKVVVYNVIGKEVATLVNDYRTAGVHNVTFDASSLSSGVYFYKIMTNSFTSTKKMVLMK